MSKPSTRRLRILFCGADSDWAELSRTEIRRRNLHFLHGFADDPGVDAFVLHRSSRRDALRRWFACRLGRKSARNDVDGMAVVRWLPERRWLPLTKVLNRLIARRALRRKLGPTQEEDAFVAIVWCYALRGIALAEWLRLEGALFLDTDHDVIHDPNLRRGNRAETEAMMLRSARNAARVFSASRHMLSWLREQGGFFRKGERRLLRLRNGVDLDRFPARRVEIGARSAGRQPVVGYVGVLSPWIDWALFVDLARRRPDWRFVITGAWYRMAPVSELHGLAHVELAGAVAGDAVPELLDTFDVALGLYRREPWLDVDSMKLHEYLAAGVPVVTTPFHESLEEDFEGLLRLAESAADFEARVEEILHWSKDEQQGWTARARAFARRNSWNVRSAEALREIREALGDPL